MSRTSLADQLLPKRFRDELDRILNQHNQKNHSVIRVVPRDSSRKTRRERRGNLRLVFAELRQLGYRNVLREPWPQIATAEERPR